MQNSKCSVKIATKVGLVAFLLFSICLPINLLGQEQDSGDATKFFTSHGKPVAAKQAGQQLLLANTDVGVEIIQGKNGFYLSRIYGIASGQDFLSADSANRGTTLWQLKMRKDKGRDEKGITVSSLDGGQLSSSIDRKASEATLHLWWKNIKVADQVDALGVEVTVTVKQGDPLSRWRINVTNRSTVYGLWEVAFPILKLQPIGAGSKTNYLTIPKCRGLVKDDPFNRKRGFSLGTHKGSFWPGSWDMQFNALYDDSSVGLYLAVEDGQGYAKRFYIDQDPAVQVMTYKVGHLPANMGYPAEDYTMTYDLCVGPFTGDWYDACQIYRKWAIKQQWCGKGPLLTRADVPKWFKESPMALKTSSAYGDRSPQTVKALSDRIVAFLDFVGMDMPIDWYMWQQFFPDKASCQREGSTDRYPQDREHPSTNVHDGIYPVLPALDSFAAACKQMEKAGGHVKAFVPAKLYDPGLNENAPFAAEAKPNQIFKKDGKSHWAWNGACWLMCYHTPWWQNRLKDEIVALVKNEGVHGMYFDTFYGGYQQCFDARHGHSHGGGNDMYLAARKLSEVVCGAMKQADSQTVATGEAPAETAIDLLDGFFLRWPVWPDMAPLLATVYGDYIPRCGSFLAPDAPGNGFYIQATSLFTAGAQMGRLRFMQWYDDWMKDFDAGSKYTHQMKFLRKLSHYWKADIGQRFLAYGQLLRPLEFAKPNPMPVSSYRDTAKYVKGLVSIPALASGVFGTHDGQLGVFVINVTDKPMEYSFELTPDRYPILSSAGYAVTQIDHTGKRGKTTLQKGKITSSGKIASYDVLFLEIKE